MARTRSWTTAAVTVVVTAGLVVPAAQATGAPDRSGERLLRDDATSGVTVDREHGRLRFVGVRAGGRIDNPGVRPSTDVEAAARDHLERYGDAFGADRAGTSLRVQGTTHSVSGQDVVRFEQRVDDVPVLGAQVVVSMRADRDVSSIGSTLTTADHVPAPRVGEQRAEEAARVIAARATRVAASSLEVVGRGRAVLDPAVFGAPAPDGARSGWRFEVGDGPAVRRLVLVDDQTGAVLLDLDENEHLERVVCDNANVPQADDVPCTSGFARTETSGASASPDVESAFALAGAVAQMYDQVAGLDLTQLLGVQTTAGKGLASTVGWCYTGETCPFDNAFWDGTQMYYGAGYAGADDVVGHEMTHGVIDRFSQLFYWGQSGSINESLADIMGEILDHRHPSPGDTASEWSLGEDLPGGAARSLSDPRLFGQPDRMTSSLYTDDVDTGYGDNGGVHTDSGVGNKTAYLISQGGTFNGQTITGIDAGDPSLTKTATLYADVIETLTSGSDYADLAARLEQSCQDLVAAHRAGFVAQDCTSVQAATLATQLRTTPTYASQPSDAPTTCPNGTRKRVLLDSETGDPASTFVGDPGWVRGASPSYGSNATSGKDSWSITSPWSDGTWSQPVSLRSAVDTPLPAGQPSYLSFTSWYLLDYYPSTPPAYYDIGTVDIDTRVGDSSGGARRAEQLPWVNGPSRTPEPGVWYGDRRGFGGDSRGWVTSRVDLSEMAGQTIRPVFTLDTDDTVLFPGWFLDDISVYTCDWVSVVNTFGPQVMAMEGVHVGARLEATAGSWAPRSDSFAYQWLRDGRSISGATRSDYIIGIADVGHRLSLRLTAAAAGLASGSAVSSAVGPVPPLTLQTRRPRVAGVLQVGRRLRAKTGAWVPSGVVLTYQWLRAGKVIPRATRATYRLTRKDRHQRVAVRVTGRLAGYSPAVVTSRPTARVR